MLEAIIDGVPDSVREGISVPLHNLHGALLHKLGRDDPLAQRAETLAALGARYDSIIPNLERMTQAVNTLKVDTSQRPTTAGVIMQDALRKLSKEIIYAIYTAVEVIQNELKALKPEIAAQIKQSFQDTLQQCNEELEHHNPQISKPTWAR